MINNSTDGFDGANNDVDLLAAGFLGGCIAGTVLHRTIEWVDTDAAGHQHNSVIMRLVEAAEAKLFRDLGLDPYFGIAPRVRHETDYRAKLYFGQGVTAAVRLQKVGTSSMEFAFKVFGHRHADRDAVLAAEGRFVTVCVPLGSDNSAPWPPAFREVLGVK